MTKTCLLFALFGAVLYSPLAHSDNIVNIAIRSELEYHVLSNCRFASALAVNMRNGTMGSVTILYPGTHLSKIGCGVDG